MTPLTFLIVCPLVFLGGFVDAVAGGGGLISLPAYLIAGVPVHMAIGTNKLSSAMGTTLTTVRFAQNGFIPWKLSAICVLFAFLGSSRGASLALRIDDHIFTILMLILLPLTAFYVLKSRSLERTADGKERRGRTLFFGIVSAFLIGMYDGFYGPGTGTFLLLALTGLAHMELRKANGVTKVINLTTNLSALAVFLWEGKVLFLLGMTAGCFGLLGNYLGSRFFIAGGVKFVKPIILLVLALFFIRILWGLLC